MNPGDPGLETWPNLDAARNGGGQAWVHTARIPFIRKAGGHSGGDPFLLIQGVEREQSGIGGEVVAIESAPRSSCQGEMVFVLRHRPCPLVEGCCVTPFLPKRYGLLFSSNTPFH